MNTIIEKIRAEVNRQREEIRPTDTGEMKVVGTPTQLEQGWLNALSWMEKVLDTLQEQPVKTDIVEDLKHYLATTPKEQIEKDWESLKEWGKVGPSVSEFLGWEQPVCDGLEEEYKNYVENDPVYSKLVNGIVGLSIARHFAQWQKSQMMKEAVEGEVIKTDKHTSVRYKSFYGTYRYFYGIADKQFKPGDKGHIIFVKED